MWFPFDLKVVECNSVISDTGLLSTSDELLLMALEDRDEVIVVESELIEIGDVAACEAIVDEDHLKLWVFCTILVSIRGGEIDSLLEVLVSVLDWLDIPVLDKVVSVTTTEARSGDMSLTFPVVCEEYVFDVITEDCKTSS